MISQQSFISYLSIKAAAMMPLCSSEDSSRKSWNTWSWITPLLQRKLKERRAFVFLNSHHVLVSHTRYWEVFCFWEFLGTRFAFGHILISASSHSSLTDTHQYSLWMCAGLLPSLWAQLYSLQSRSGFSICKRAKFKRARVDLQWLVFPL